MGKTSGQRRDLGRYAVLVGGWPRGSARGWRPPSPPSHMTCILPAVWPAGGDQPPRLFALLSLSPRRRPPIRCGHCRRDVGWGDG